MSYVKVDSGISSIFYVCVNSDPEVRLEIPQCSLGGCCHARRCVRQVRKGLTVQKTVEVPQLQFLHGCGRRCDTQRQVPGSPAGASDTFIYGMFKCWNLWHFSHSVRMDVSAHFTALDDEEFFVVEGSGVAGTPGVRLPNVLPPQFSACVGFHG